MLNHTTHKACHNKPKLSVVFWIAFLTVYLIGFLAIASLTNAALYDILETSDAPLSVAIKMEYVRLPLIVFVLSVLPVLLWKSLARALLLLKLATAIAIVIYVDDHLVLYEIAGYPSLFMFKMALFLRPVAIMALLWMSFELHFRAKIGQQA